MSDGGWGGVPDSRGLCHVNSSDVILEAVDLQKRYCDEMGVRLVREGAQLAGKVGWGLRMGRETSGVGGRLSSVSPAVSCQWLRFQHGCFKC